MHAQVLVVVVALAACRGNATPGPRESLGAGMLSWGFVAVRYRLIISPLVLCLFGALIGAGVPRFEVDQGSISEWVAQGTRLEQQIKDWDTYVDDSVTDRISAASRLHLPRISAASHPHLGCISAGTSTTRSPTARTRTSSSRPRTAPT